MKSTRKFPPVFGYIIKSRIISPHPQDISKEEVEEVRCNVGRLLQEHLRNMGPMVIEVDGVLYSIETKIHCQVEEKSLGPRKDDACEFDGFYVKGPK